MSKLSKWPVLSITGIIIVTLASIAIGIIIKQQGIPEQVAYVGSTACASCHESLYTQWHSSLHPRMMRPVTTETVLADLSPNNPELLFNPQEAVWVIGSKWEQQFMGHDGKTETLLPGAWLVAPKRWQQTGWDGWQIPVPLQRCHGCHVVGLNVDSGQFVETGIGCESCHGPGEWHVKTFGLGRIYSSPDAQVCGQCHTRGRSNHRATQTNKEGFKGN